MTGAKIGFRLMAESLARGKRTGVTAVDRLNIVAHDKFQEIIDEASRPDSPVRLQQVIIDPNELAHKIRTVVSQSNLSTMLGVRPDPAPGQAELTGANPPTVFTTPADLEVARLTHAAIRRLESRPNDVPGVSYLQKPEVQATLVREVAGQYRPSPLALDGVAAKPDIEAIVAKATEVTVQQTIAIPRIVVLPKSEVRAGFKPFTLDLSTINYQAPSDELWIQHLRTNAREIVGLSKHGMQEARLEDYIVSGLVDFDDVAYDDHADLLYDLAGQVVHHLSGYLEEADVAKVLRLHQREIARFVHAQMQNHHWEDAVEYEIKINAGFTSLKDRGYSVRQDGDVLDFQQSPADKSNMARYLFVGFARCLYPEEQFQSDSERKLSVILDRETDKWFKPAKGQFQIWYKLGIGEQEYQPDFVAEAADAIYMLEPKARNEMETPEVIAKRDAAVAWCKRASEYAATYEGGKPWKYVLIPHDAIAENMTLGALVGSFVATGK